MKFKFMQLFSALALAFLWLCGGTFLLPHFQFSHSLTGLIVYTIWGAAGITPFWLILRQSYKNRQISDMRAAIFGLVSVLIFCGTLSALIYYDCVENGVWVPDKLFREENLDTIYVFLLFPAVLVFLPVFAISALVLGALRKKFAGFFQNLGLLAIMPLGVIAVMFVSLWQMSEGQSGRTGNLFLIFLALGIWLAFLLLPYGFMAWRGGRKKEEKTFYNGIAGLGASIFFLLGLWWIGYLGRGV